MGVAPAQYAGLKYDQVRDFTSIGLTAEAPAVIVARKDFRPITSKSLSTTFRKTKHR
jgi:tripartite-type tricarboxylate transporter receptor subunit TctC